MKKLEITLLIVVIIVTIIFIVWLYNGNKKMKQKLVEVETNTGNYQYKNWKFIKEVTINGTYKDGHVPTPTRTFKVGNIIHGVIFQPESSYPVSNPNLLHFNIGDESYTTEAANAIPIN